MMPCAIGNAVRMLLLVALLLLTGWGTSVAFGGDVWTAEPADGRRAVPNDPAPPARRLPAVMLPPVRDAGTVRRVDLPKGGSAVALTFDLCETANVTTGCDMEILGFLKRNKIPATLFMGGKWMRSHRKRAEQLVGDPLFEIGNHAWSHGNFGIMSPARMREEVLWTQAQYEAVRSAVLMHRPGAVPADVPSLFRLPYGRCRDAALALLSGFGLRVIQWDVVADKYADNASAAAATATLRRIRPGSIVLFHANCVPRGGAVLLRRVVRALSGQGYRFVTVGELLRMGKAVHDRDGYFERPGDNLRLDGMFGVDGTGVRR